MKTKTIFKNLCLTLLLVLSACMLASAQEKKVKLQKEDKYFYIDSTGKKKYVSSSKTQTMWTEILQQCPQCIIYAEKYNVHIYQNDKYVKKKTEETSSND